MKQNTKWSCFVLHEDGFWDQPTYRLMSDMTENDFTQKVLAEWQSQFRGRKYFLVVGVREDEACPDDDFIRELS
jgi:hypothetical protein